MNVKVMMLFPIILGVIDFPCNVFTDPDYSAIIDPQARWRAYHLTSYTVVQTRNCFCIEGGRPMKVTVRNNAIVNVQRTDLTPIPMEQWAGYKTIDELFALLKLRDSVASLTVSYDRRYGYPTSLWIDYLAQAADDEIEYRTEGLQRLGN